jgi:hypothetical protein
MQMQSKSRAPFGSYEGRCGAWLFQLKPYTEWWLGTGWLISSSLVQTDMSSNEDAATLLPGPASIAAQFAKRNISANLELPSRMQTVANAIQYRQLSLFVFSFL